MYKPEYEQARKRKNVFSCRLDDDEKALVDAVNALLNACTNNDGLMMVYRYAAQHIEEVKAAN